MRQRPFRFLHASDLHLDRPVTGLGDLPAHLLPRVIDAPRRSAERLFDAALKEQVDFVVLSGNILNPYQTGPWGPVFLVDQFAKLAAANIPVYWAAGKSDAAERWPAELPLPPNVTLFPTSHVEEPVFEKDGFSIARILGESRSPERRKIRPGEFNPDHTGLFTLAVTVGKVNPSLLKRRGIDYWALGGMPSRHTSYGDAPGVRTVETATEPVAESDARNTVGKLKPSDRNAIRHESKANGAMPAGPFPKKTEDSQTKDQAAEIRAKSEALKRVRDDFTRSSIVHYPGPMLARSFEETGNYGATLVEVDETGKMHLSLVPTTPLRFVSEQVRFEPGMSFDRLKDELRDRLIAHQSLQDDYDLYLSWAIDSSEEFELKLRREGTGDRIRDKLRQEFGMTEPFAWVVEIKPAVPENFPPEFYDQETIMGDYLRKLRRYHLGEADMPSLERYLPQDGPIFPPGDLAANDPASQNPENDALSRLDDYAEPLLVKGGMKRDDMLREAGMLGVDLLGKKEESGKGNSEKLKTNSEK